MTKIIDKTIKKAVRMACEVRKNSYSPYSDFAVGAAVITSDNSIFTAANVENSSYGATVCAERAAVFKAVSDGKKNLEAIVIAAEYKGKSVYPCGVCRQVLAEFNPSMKVYLVNSSSREIEKIVSLKSLYPDNFSMY
ncbi:MAG: cytidine deaminase [bacterium]